MTEFRRAQTELKSSFDREMKNLERETGINELAATSYQSGSYDYDQSTYNPSYYEDSYVSAINPPVPGTADHSTPTNLSTNGASALSGAGSTAAFQLQPAEGSIASGHLEPAPASPPPALASAAPAEHGSAGFPAPAEAASHTAHS